MVEETAHMLLQKMEVQLRDLMDDNDDDDDKVDMTEEPEVEIPSSDDDRDQELQRIEMELQEMLQAVGSFNSSVANQKTIIDNSPQSNFDESTLPRSRTPSQDLGEIGYISSVETTEYTSSLASSNTSLVDSESWERMRQEGIHEKKKSPPYLQTINKDIQTAVDSIREEAARVEAGILLDQVQTMGNEIQCLTKLAKAQQDQIQHLKNEIREKNDTLGMVELEKDLLKVDAIKVKYDLDTCIRRMKEMDLKVKTDDRKKSRHQKPAESSKDSNSTTSKSHVMSLPVVTPIEGNLCSAPLGSSPESENTGSSKPPLAEPSSHTPTKRIQCIKPPRQDTLKKNRSATTRSQTPRNESSKKTSKASVNYESIPLASEDNGQATTIINKATQVRRPDNQHTEAGIQSKSTHETSSSTSSKSHSVSRSVFVTSQTAGTGTSNKNDWMPPRAEYKTLVVANEPQSSKKESPAKLSMCAAQFFSCKTNQSPKSSHPIRCDSKSLQAQVEELSQRLMASVRASEELRKRLAMITHYYETTVQQLHENVTSEKKNKKRMEKDLVRQIAILDKSKQATIQKLAMRLRQKEEEISVLKKKTQQEEEEEV